MRLGDAVARDGAALVLLHHDEQLADDVGPAVADEILFLESAGDEDVEVVHALLLPAGLQALRPLRIGRPVGAHVDRRRRALEDVEMLGRRAEMRHALHGRRAGADDADALVAQTRQVAVGIAAGVGVVPAAGVERVSRERLDAGDPGQLGSIERPVRHDDEVRLHPVAAVGRDDPARAVLVPAHLGHFRLEARVAVEIVLAADGAAVREDLGRARVLLARHVAELFEQRQVDVRLDVAHRARVAVPVPGAAEVAALLDDADVRRRRPRAGAPRPAARRSRRRSRPPRPRPSAARA